MKRLLFVVAFFASGLVVSDAPAQSVGGVSHVRPSLLPLRVARPPAPFIHVPQVTYQQYQYDRTIYTPRWRPVFPNRPNTIRDRLFGPRPWDIYKPVEGGQ